ncbi:MAG: hypothetical protein GAK41_00615 [Burkholderia gladioli]|nr:MAG: hypothetical protein GAK41_00615 [Burkholderia gladioli]
MCDARESDPYNVGSSVLRRRLVSLPAADLSAALLRERAARYAAEAALFARDQALSVALHDLRSPLNAMHSWWAYVLERQLPPGDVSLQRALGGIRTGIEQQTKLIETALGDERGVTLVLDAGSARGTSLVADAERLSQALWALTVFAIEASTPGATVTLSCDALGSVDSVTRSMPRSRPIRRRSSIRRCRTRSTPARAARRCSNATVAARRGRSRCATASRRARRQLRAAPARHRRPRALLRADAAAQGRCMRFFPARQTYVRLSASILTLRSLPELFR